MQGFFTLYGVDNVLVHLLTFRLCRLKTEAMYTVFITIETNEKTLGSGTFLTSNKAELCLVSTVSDNLRVPLVLYLSNVR